MRRRILLATVFLPIATLALAQVSTPLKSLKSKSQAAANSSATVSTDRLTDPNQPLPDPNVIPGLKQHFEYVLPRMCVSAIAIGPDFKCVGPDKENLKCSGIVVTVRGKIDECLQINVVKDR